MREGLSSDALGPVEGVARSVSAFLDDEAALAAMSAMVMERPEVSGRARMIQFSGHQASPLIEVLLRRGTPVDLLLAHPVQLLKSPNVPLRDFQLHKMAAFHSIMKADLPSPERLNVRYYLTPASIRGVAIDNLLCCLGWYTHEDHWLWGHNNASIVSRPDPALRDPLTSMFDRVWGDMWSRAITAVDDQLNVSRILQRRAPPQGRLHIKGIVVRGHGVASGSSRPDGLGTIQQQQESLGRWIDWSYCWPGTINVSIAPRACLWRHKAATIEGLRWSSTRPPEDFGLSRCAITISGEAHRGWVYCPLPRTKTQDLHNPSIVEVIAPRIDGVRVGEPVSLELDTTDFLVD